jgi:NADH-quinone oxidoreductase subunit C
VTTSPSETTEPDSPAPDPLAGYAAEVTEAVGAERTTTGFATLKATVARDRWVDAARAARDGLGLVYFSYLSAIDWSNDVVAGDPPSEEVEERYEVICAVGDIDAGRLVHLSTELPKDDAVLDSLVEVYPGANWHEREANEMFGILFRNHPNLAKLYLPDAFEGHPLRKSYPLLTREVKPWPGKVDVEGMPTTENPES